MQDPFLWLEELESERALSWTQKQNEVTLEGWAQGLRFQKFHQKALLILSQKEKLTMGQIYQNEVYHLWKDEKNPLGVWRKTRQENLGDPSKWQILFDLDEHSKKIGQATFLNSTQFLKGSQRALLSLSLDGKDACEMREWDLEKNGFVENGFSTKLSKDHLDWVDENHVLWSSTEVSTHCGYASRIYSWKRGQKPQLLMEIPHSSMVIWASVHQGPDGEPQVFIGHNLDWNDAEIYFWRQDQLVQTQLPLRSRIWDLHQDRIVLGLEKDWENFPSGSVLISRHPGQRTDFKPGDFEMIFRPTEKISFQDLSVCKEGIVLFYSDHLQNKIQIWKDGSSVETEIPIGSTVGGLFSSVEKDQVFTSLQSFVDSPGWYRLKQKTWEMIQKTPAHFSSENVVSLQEWTLSRDGAEIPYWVVYDKRFQFPRPTLQLGYGGFMSSLFPFYSDINGALWIEQGGIFVLAQIRGGAEFGVSWHEAAKLENKQKSYDDFIAISEDLIRKGYTTAKQLAIRGRSNGGLLVGATLTQRPDLYGAALIEVPLLDMLRYVELPPGSSWIGEYGDPRDPHFREIILKYSPYQNISKHSKYPPVLIRTARSDDRVHPGHARKMAAMFQQLGHPCWFFEEELGGHGATPVKDQAFQHALVYEFLMRSLG